MKHRAPAARRRAPEPPPRLAGSSAARGTPFLRLTVPDLVLTTAASALSIPADPRIFSFSPLPSWHTLSTWVTSAEVLTCVAAALAWILAFKLTGFHSGPQIRTPWSNPASFLVLGMSAWAIMHLSAFFLPDRINAPSLTALLLPLFLLALAHQIAHAINWILAPRYHRALLIAPRSSAVPLEELMNRHARHVGLKVVGLMKWDDHMPILRGHLEQHFEEIVEAMRDCGATTLVMTTSTASDPEDVQDLRWRLENTGLDLALVLEPTCLAPDLLHTKSAPGIMVAATTARRDRLDERLIRRTLDLAISSFLIVLLLPLWIALALIIKLEDRGPALFIQERVGRQGVTFPMLKFRTMATDAEARLADLLQQERLARVAARPDEDDPDTGILFKLEEDPRITRVGRFLRRTSLDELPQLFNVWVGHMSLVGPRPPLRREVESYSPRVMRKFNVRPGMTGLWQVSGRSDLPWREAVRLDLHYVEHRSIRMDLWILLRTFPAVFNRTGAY